ncbi:MAG: VCBS repeat-containing protein [Candidatus Wallbacteria bacterium]|nr:VCBS repeat-containing protein [Candidatus Wallbacteria bacterium]
MSHLGETSPARVSPAGEARGVAGRTRWAFLLACVVLAALAGLTRTWGQSVPDGYSADLSLFRVTLSPGTHFLYLPLVPEDSKDLLGLFGPEWQRLESVSWWDQASRRWVATIPAAPLPPAAGRPFQGHALRLCVLSPTTISLAGQPPEGLTIEQALKLQVTQEFVGIPGTTPSAYGSVSKAAAALGKDRTLKCWDVASASWLDRELVSKQVWANEIAKVRSDLEEAKEQRKGNDEIEKLKKKLAAWEQPSLGTDTQAELARLIESHLLSASTLYHWSPAPKAPEPATDPKKEAAPTPSAPLIQAGIPSDKLKEYPQELPVPKKDAETALAIDVVGSTFRVKYANDRIAEAVAMAEVPEALRRITDLPRQAVVTIAYDGKAPSKPTSYKFAVPRLAVGSGEHRLLVRPRPGLATLDLRINPAGGVFADGVTTMPLQVIEAPTSPPSQKPVFTPVSLVYLPKCEAAGEGYGDGGKAGPILDVVLPVGGSTNPRLFKRYTAGWKSQDGKVFAPGPMPLDAKLSTGLTRGVSVTAGLWLETGLALEGRLESRPRWARRTLRVNAVALDPAGAVERVVCADVVSGTVKALGFWVPLTGIDASTPRTATFAAGSGLEVDLGGRWSATFKGGGSILNLRVAKGFELGILPTTAMVVEPGPKTSRVLKFSPTVWLRVHDKDKLKELLLSMQPAFKKEVATPTDVKGIASALDSLRSKLAGFTLPVIDSGLPGRLAISLKDRVTAPGTRLNLAAAVVLGLSKQDTLSFAGSGSIDAAAAAGGSRDWSIQGGGTYSSSSRDARSVGVTASHTAKASGASRTSLAFAGNFSLDRLGEIVAVKQTQVQCDAAFTHEKLASGKQRNVLELRAAAAGGWTFQKGTVDKGDLVCLLRNVAITLEGEQGPAGGGTVPAPSRKLTLVLDALMSRSKLQAGELEKTAVAAQVAEEMLDAAGTGTGAVGQFSLTQPLVARATQIPSGSAAGAGGHWLQELFTPSLLFPWSTWERDKDNWEGKLVCQFINLELGPFRPIKVEGSVGRSEGATVWGLGAEGQFKSNTVVEGQPTWFTVKAGIERTKDSYNFCAEAADADVGKGFTFRKLFLAREAPAGKKLWEGLPDGVIAGGNVEIIPTGDRTRPPALARLLVDLGDRTMLAGTRIPAAAMGLTTSHELKAITFDGRIGLEPVFTARGVAGFEFAPPWMEGAVARATGTLEKSATGWNVQGSVRNLSVKAGKGWELALDSLSVGWTRTVSSAAGVKLATPTNDWSYAGKATVRLPKAFVETVKGWQLGGVGASVPETVAANVSGTNKVFSVQGTLEPKLGLKVGDDLTLGISRVNLTKASPWRPAFLAELERKGTVYKLPGGFDAGTGSMTFTLPATQEISLDLSPGPELAVRGGTLTLDKSGKATLSATATVGILERNVTGHLNFAFQKSTRGVTCSLRTSETLTVAGVLTIQPGLLELTTETVGGRRQTRVLGSVEAVLYGKKVKASLASGAGGALDLELDGSALDWSMFGDVLTITPGTVRASRRHTGDKLGFSGSLKCKLADGIGILPADRTIEASFSRDSQQNTTFVLDTGGITCPIGIGTVTLGSLRVEASQSPKSRSFAGKCAAELGEPISTLLGKDPGSTVRIDGMDVTYGSLQGGNALRISKDVNRSVALDLLGNAATLTLARVQLGKQGVGVGLVADFTRTLGRKLVGNLMVRGPKQVSGDIAIQDSGGRPSTLEFDFRPVGKVRFENLKFVDDWFGSGVQLDAHASVGDSSTGFFVDLKKGFISLKPASLYFDELTPRVRFLGFGAQAAIAYPRLAFPGATPDPKLVKALAKSLGSPPDHSELRSAAATVLQTALCGADPVFKGPGLGKVYLQFPKEEFQSLFPDKSPFQYDGNLIKLKILVNESSSGGWRKGIWYPLILGIEKAGCASKEVVDAFTEMLKVLTIAGKVITQPSALAELVDEEKRSGEFSLNLILAEAAGGYQLTPKTETEFDADSVGVKKFFMLGLILDYLKLGSAKTGFKSMWEIAQGLKDAEKRKKEDAGKAVAAGGEATTKAGDTFMTGTLRGQSHTFADVNGDGRADAILRLEAKILVCSSTGSRFIDPAGPWISEPAYEGVAEVWGDYTGDGKADLCYYRDGFGWVVKESTGDGQKHLTAGQRDRAALPYFCGDVTGDGKADFVVATTSGLTVWRSTGTGEPVMDDKLWYSGDMTKTLAAVADFNGDGRADALSISGTEIQVAVSTGENFEAFTKWVGKPWDWPKKTIAGDFNGDGRIDLVYRDISGYIRVLESMGTGFDAPGIWLDRAAPMGGQDTLFAADVDGDGRSDLIALDATKAPRIAFAKPKEATKAARFELLSTDAEPASVARATATTAALTASDRQAILRDENQGMLETLDYTATFKAKGRPDTDLYRLVQGVADARQAGGYLAFVENPPHREWWRDYKHPEDRPNAAEQKYLNAKKPELEKLYKLKAAIEGEGVAIDDSFGPNDYRRAAEKIASRDTKLQEGLKAKLEEFLSTFREIYADASVVRKMADDLGVSPVQLCAMPKDLDVTTFKSSQAETYAASPKIAAGTLETDFKVVDRWIDTSVYVDQARELEKKWSGLRPKTDTGPYFESMLRALIKQYVKDYGMPAAGRSLTWKGGDIELFIFGKRTKINEFRADVQTAYSVKEFHAVGWGVVHLTEELGTARFLGQPERRSGSSDGVGVTCESDVKLELSGGYLKGVPRCTTDFVQETQFDQRRVGDFVNLKGRKLLPGNRKHQLLHYEGTSVGSEGYALTGWRVVHVLRDPANRDIGEFKIETTDRGTVLFRGPSGMRYATIVPGQSMLTQLREFVSRLALIAKGALFQKDYTPYPLLLRVWNNLHNSESDFAKRYTCTITHSFRLENLDIGVSCKARQSGLVDADFHTTLRFRSSDPHLVDTNTNEQSMSGEGSHIVLSGNKLGLRNKLKWWDDAAPMLYADSELSKTFKTQDEARDSGSPPPEDRPLHTFRNKRSRLDGDRVEYRMPTGKHHRLSSELVNKDGAKPENSTVIEFLSKLLRVEYRADVTTDGTLQDVRIGERAGDDKFGKATNAEELKKLLNSGSLTDNEVYPYSETAPYGAGDYVVRGYTRSNVQMIPATAPALEQDLRQAIGSKILYRQIVVTKPSEVAGTYTIDTETLATSRKGAGLEVDSDTAGMTASVDLASKAKTVPATVTLPGSARLRRSLTGEMSGTVEISSTAEKSWTRQNPVVFSKPGKSGVPEGLKYGTGIVPAPGGINTWAELKSPDWFNKLGKLEVALKGAIKDGGWFLFEGLANCTILNRQCGDALLRISSSDGLYLRALMDYTLVRSFLEGRINKSGIFMIGDVGRVVKGTGIQAKADLASNRNPILKIAGQILVAGGEIARTTLDLGKDCLQVRFCIGNDDVGVDAQILMKYAKNKWSLCVEGRGYVDTLFGRVRVRLPTIFVDAGTGNWGTQLLFLGVCGNLRTGHLGLAKSVSGCAGYGDACGKCN